MHDILLVEDDSSLIEGLEFSLKKNGFLVDVARTVKDAHLALGQKNYDLLLIDLALPDGSGFEICRKVRLNSDVPIIFLTASDEEVNIVMGLDIGGDDYITKPFRLNELISRINAILRRTGRAGTGLLDRPARKPEYGLPCGTAGMPVSALSDGPAGKPACELSDGLAEGLACVTSRELSSNGITVRPEESRAWKNGREIFLTVAEYRLLCLLMRNPGRVLTRGTILDKLWDGSGNYIDDNTLSVYVRRLREKIEDDPGNPVFLQTVRGFGYRWNVAG